jgi:hypothetical protein
MNVTLGGREFPLARFKYADVEHLGRCGALKALRDAAGLDPWEVSPAIREILATSIRRAGIQVTADELGEIADGTEGGALSTAASDVLRLSGFLPPAGDAPPNVESPTEGVKT